MKVDEGEGGSGSVVSCSTIVGGMIGSVAVEIVSVSGTESIGAVEIDIEDSSGRPSSVVSINTIIDGGTDSAATSIVGVSGTRCLDTEYWILETAVRDDSDAAVGGGCNVTARLSLICQH